MLSSAGYQHQDFQPAVTQCKHSLHHFPKEKTKGHILVPIMPASIQGEQSQSRFLLCHLTPSYILDAKPVAKFPWWTSICQETFQGMPMNF